MNINSRDRISRIQQQQVREGSPQLLLRDPEASLDKVRCIISPASFGVYSREYTPTEAASLGAETQQANEKSTVFQQRTTASDLEVLSRTESPVQAEGHGLMKPTDPPLWLCLEILTMKIPRRIGDKGQQWQRPIPNQRCV